MKIITLFFVCLVAVYSSYCQVSASEFSKLSWLEGEWNRTNVKPGRSGHESWTKLSDHEYKGWGISMKGTDTAFVEKLQIIIKDSKIYYVVDTPQNPAPVYFTFTALGNNSFECENPTHDFPKKITYNFDGKKINATISGNGNAVDFVFEKK